MAGTYEYGTKTVSDLLNLAKSRSLNLAPAFQRQSVWKLSDRRKLIESMLSEQPLPSIFLYRTSGRGGRQVFDVIDGKQRLESIFMFVGAKGFKADQFAVRIPDATGNLGWAEWSTLTKSQKSQILSTKFQVVEVDWQLSDVIDLFVRINSTGKSLTGAEKRNARWIDNPVLKSAKGIADEHVAFFKQHRVFTSGQMMRMKHIEFASELLVSVNAGGPINKKPAMDRLVAGGSIDRADLLWSERELRKTLKCVDTMFPQLSQTRMHTSAELYTLIMLVYRMRADGLVLNDRRRNEIAQQLLIDFSVGVDEVNHRTKQGEGTRADQLVYLKYLHTVRSDTDSSKQRNKRADILGHLLDGVFESVDSKRAFSPQQRRMLWHSSQVKRCAYSGCNVVLTWNDFTVDHIKPHSKGGRSDLSNAQLMCRSHNSAKGAR